MHRSLAPKLLPFIMVFICATASAALDDLSGTRVSLAGTQSLFAAPPLPSLDATTSELNVQASYLIADYDDPDGVIDGDFKGGAFGLGYSSEAPNRLGHFNIMQVSDMKGKIKVSANDTSEFRTTGVAWAGGASLRVFGEKKSPLAFGVFGGPALMYFNSKLDVNGMSFGAKPLIGGVIAGAQIRIMIGKVVLRPYVIAMHELTDKCKLTSGTGNVASEDACPYNDKAMVLPASFSAWGLVAGWGSLQFNVYSKLKNDEVLDEVAVQRFTLSYTF